MVRRSGKGWSNVAVVCMLAVLTSCSAENAGGEGGAGGRGDVTDDGDSSMLERSAGDVEARVPGDEVASLVPVPLNAQTCTANNQCATGFCVDGFCCDNGCANKCMACSAAKKGGGLDGICGSVAANTDPDNDCPSGECDGKNVCKNYNGVACTSSAQCLSKYCVDGVCCGNICMGSCQACSAVKKGSGSDGVCGSIKAATDPDNECSGSCNGSGACDSSPQPTYPNGTACTGASQCQSGYCADGVCCDSWCLGTCQACSAAKKKQGADGVCGNIAYDQDPDEECWGGGCNGAGVCKQYNGVPCSDKSQCLSNYCVDGFCCGNICTQMCYACSEAKKGQGSDGVCGPIIAGKDVENECNPGECNGSGTCNQPQTPQANGTTCVSGGQCASGNCVDGVCCDTTCTGTCMACTTAKKGSGANGICGPIASETNPDAECNGGKCDGTGACRYYNGAPCSATNQCFSNYCVDGVCCGGGCTSTCYACSAAKKGSGSDGACGPIGNTRDPDNECNPGECNGSGACNQAQNSMLANGAACTLSTQCLSGFCVDGVCCNTACAASCNACTAVKKGSGADGTCGAIANTTNPDGECAGGYCNGAGACVYFNGVACSSASQCISTYCVDGNCCGNACTGACMACTAAKRGGGVNGQCGIIANGTDPDNECAAGSCNGAGACTVVSASGLPAGSACVAGSECESRICNNLVCESAKPANGPLVWMTLRDGAIIAESAGMDPPMLILRNNSAQLDAGGAIRVAGTVSKKHPSLPALGLIYDPLSGHFNAAGEPQLSYIVLFEFPNILSQRLYRGGTEAYVKKSGNCLCTNWWPGGTDNQWATPTAGLGSNDAGQRGAMLERSICSAPCLHATYNVGDGVERTDPILVRYSAAGAIELTIPPPPMLTDPVVLGPVGEFHSLDATNHRIVKYSAVGALAWNLPFTGTLASSAFDVDATGNVLIGFSFTGSVDFGAGPMTAAGTDLGLVKLNSNGGVIWQKQFAGGVEDVHLVRAGNADFAILAKRTAAMNLGTGSITGNTVLAKFDSSGVAQWHANFNDMGVLTLSADKAGSIYVGTSSVAANFGWGTPMSNLSVGIAMAKYGTCTGGAGCKARSASCSANTECASGYCVSGACF